MTRVDHETFGAVRSLLAAPPGAVVIQRLVALLDPFMIAEDERLFQYLHDQLRRWPCAIRRVIPWDWIVLVACSAVDEKVLALFNAIEPDEECYLDAADLVSVLTSEHATIAHLRLNQELSEVGVFDALARSPGAAALRTLNHGYAVGADELIERLVAAPTLCGVETLDLRHARLSDEGFIALVRAPHLKTLRALHVQNNEITARGIQAFASSSQLCSLRVLDLRRNRINADGFRALAEAPHLATLDWLYLDDHAHALADSPYLNDSIRRYWRR